MKAICFYLPQYHPVRENDSWWGAGFTEWTNVAKARPLFKGHYQPHIPADLGFYDLRLEETRIAQADLARAYGIAGFCYYHYWFDGKQLLARPFDEVLESGKPDFPFSLCWANENWTRGWDGLEHEILLAQDYSAYDARKHFEWLARAFNDPRYIQVDGKPLFLIYRADMIPQMERVIDTWREMALSHGLSGIFLCAVHGPRNTFGYAETMRLGFDAVVDFAPTARYLPPPTSRASYSFIPRKIYNRLLDKLPFSQVLPQRSIPNIHSYRQLVETAIAAPEMGAKVFPCVMPSWDNSPRRRQHPTIIQNLDAGLYQRWLEHAFQTVSENPHDHRIAFINAWNEWGEGCHLEPDLQNGRKFLEATKAAMAKFEYLDRSNRDGSLALTPGSAQD